MPRRFSFVPLLALFALPSRGALTFGDESKPVPKFSETTQVTASRNVESIADAPVSISVIDQQQIQTSAADNYADLLRGVPGVNVVQLSARDLGVRTRGASGVAEHRQLTLLDGRSIYLDFYGVVLWDFLPVNLDEIKQIEILRGPGSALWGPNALSGVINVLTKTPREMKGGLLTAIAGDRGTRAGSVRWAGTSDRFSYKASTSFFEQRAWDRDRTMPDGTPFPSFDNEGTRQPKADLRLDWGAGASPLWSMKVGYGGTTGIFHSRLGPFVIEPGTYVSYAEIDRNTNVVDVKAYWNHLHGDAPNLVNGIDFAFAMDTYAGEASGRRTIGSKQVLIYGGNLRASRFNLSLAPRGRARNEVGAFAEDTALVSHNVMVNVGARLDTFDVVGTTLSPRTSLIYKPRPNDSLRIAYNRAFRAPSIIDNFLDTTLPNRLGSFVFQTRAAGNEDLRVELVDALELGYTLSISTRELLTASIYRNVVKNNIVFVPTELFTVDDHQLPKTFGFLNVGKEIDEGVELSWDENWSDVISTRTSYTYQRDPKVSRDLSINRPPRNQASLTVNARQHRWFASASTAYTGKAFWADVLDSRFWGFTHSYWIVNAALGLATNPRTQLVMNATDLLDKNIKEHVFGDIIRRKATMEVRYRF